MASRPNRNWIWYFVGLAVLTVISLSILIAFNLSQQLTLKQLETARELWKRNGPQNYDMEYKQQGGASETRKVQVREGKVVLAVSNGQILEERLFRYSDMNALFGFVEDFLREDAQPGKPRRFCVATFDPVDGHLVHYVRRVLGTEERLEITVFLQPLPHSTHSN